jgi:uncharacterized membrane protein
MPPLDAAAAAQKRASYRSAGSVEELTEKNVRSIAALEREAKNDRSGSMRVIDAITAFCGSLPFALLHAALFAAWIIVNSWPGLPHFDPFPFTLLTLVVSLEAIFLATFILISQNEETRLTERRNALDLQINLLTEQENTKILSVLERIAAKLGVELTDDTTLAVLEQATRPEQLAEQIDRLTDKR